MKYKLGDRVRVRQWEAMKREFGLDEEGCINTPIWTFGDGVKKYCGQVLTIAFINRENKYYRCKEDDLFLNWVDEMFEGYAFEYGDEIEVSDDGKRWNNVIYLGYIDGAVSPYIAILRDDFNKKRFIQCGFRYARPIRHTLEIKILVNGKEVNEPLSLETAKRFGLVK